MSGWQKLGITTDTRARLAALQTATGTDLMLHASVAVPFGEAHAVQRAAHATLAGSRVKNEWFDTSPAEAVAAVHRAAGPWIGQTAQRAVVPAGVDRDLPLFGFEPPAKAAAPFSPETLMAALAGPASPLRECVAVVVCVAVVAVFRRER